MRIDLLKMIRNLLFSGIRKPKVTEFIRSLLAEVPKACNDFELFSCDAKYRANANASVISLEHHIEREFDVKVKITELDGKPFDFLVTTTGSVDENRLKALIDNYKLYGKSYVFSLEGVVFTAEFTDYVCENMVEVYSAEFTNYVCEKREVVEVTIYAYMKYEGLWVVEAYSDKPVKSSINITGHLVLDDAYAERFFFLELTPGGGISDFSIQSDATKMAEKKIFLSSFLPSSDEYYDYYVNFRY
jgi:hypothetical protein